MVFVATISHCLSVSSQPNPIHKPYRDHKLWVPCLLETTHHLFSDFIYLAEKTTAFFCACGFIKGEMHFYSIFRNVTLKIPQELVSTEYLSIKSHLPPFCLYIHHLLPHVSILICFRDSHCRVLEEEVYVRVCVHAHICMYAHALMQVCWSTGP